MMKRSLRCIATLVAAVLLAGCLLPVQLAQGGMNMPGIDAEFLARAGSSKEPCDVILRMKAPPLVIQVPGAGSEPAEAVRVLAGRLQANDLPGFARAALPPADYVAVDAAWRAGRSRWPISELPLSTRLPGLLATLAAPGAEARLQQSFDGQLAGQGADLKSAARSLTLFGAQYLRKQPQYTAAQRAYYIAIVQALGHWGAHAPLGDRGRARAAIQRLAASARRTGLYSEADFSAAGLDGSLARLAPWVLRRTARRRVL